MPRRGKISDFWLRLGELVGPEFKSMTQTQVGMRFDVGQSMVTRWKTGEDTPALPRAIDIAMRHGVCVEWLLTGRGPKFPGAAPDPEMSRLLEFWSKLLPETKHNIVGYAVLQRSIQSTASPSHIKEVHDKLQAANHIARQNGPRAGRHD